METWKDIKGFEGEYQVSDQGRIRSLDRCKTNIRGVTVKYEGKILKAKANSSGYDRVFLRSNNIAKRYFVHRLVAIHFVDNPNEKEFNVVNHLDSDHTNNKATNLEWTTFKGNMQHALKNGRLKRTAKWLEHLHASQQKTYKSVEGYDPHTNKVKAKYKYLNACKADGYQPSCVSNCCKGIRQTHKGLKWRYVE